MYIIPTSTEKPPFPTFYYYPGMLTIEEINAARAAQHEEEKRFARMQEKQLEKPLKKWGKDLIDGKRAAFGRRSR